MKRIAFVISAGIVASLQIGKGIIAIPAILADMTLSLFQVSAILSTFAVFGATTGMAAGVAAPRLGARNCLIAGLLSIGIGALAGAFSQSFAQLLTTRVVEGIGFILIATSAPALLARLTDERNRAQVFATWGIYLPLGMGLMILTSMAIGVGSWRLLWAVNGLVAVAWAGIALALVAPDPPAARDATSRGTLAATLRDFAADRRPLIVGAIFFLYGNLYFAVVGLLPAFLTERFDAPAGLVAPLTATVIFCNVGGNLLGGFLLRSGCAFDRVILAGFVVATVASALVFTAPGNSASVMLIACLGMGVAGMIPASVMASAPAIARNLAQVGAMVGLFMQGSTLGQFTGPPAQAFIAERAGWEASSLFILAVGGLGLFLAISIRRFGTVPARAMP